jgi:two-component system sensor histidine kinase/response regulator
MTPLPPPHPVSDDLDEVADALRENDTRLRAMVNSALDAIMMIDSEGLTTFWNPAAERILGYPSAEALGRNLHALIVPDRFHAAHHRAFPAFRLSGDGPALGKTLELSARRKDGVEIAVALSLSGVHLGDRWHAVGILRDITTQKQTEEALTARTLALEEANRQLEAAVARATDMAVAAEAANIAKGRFLANMSHEIRTPMNGVIGMTGLLLDTDLTDEQRRYAETVRASGDALLSVISDILDFSKIDAGKLELETLDFNPHATLEEAAELLAVRAHEKHLEFICRIDPAVPDVAVGDAGRLRQILLNLGGNAVKFTPVGEVQISAMLESETDDAVVIRFAVRDSGIGIPGHKLPLLFGAFQQVDASTTRQYGGTGLGLAISKRLVELMGGAIGAESEDGRGSTFWFTARLGKPRSRGRRHEPLHDALRRARMLIVDDNATNRIVLSEQLTSWGVRQSAADSAAGALDMLRTARVDGDPFDLVITDMQMPDVDGESLGRIIKTDAELSNTLLIMMTSLRLRGSAERLTSIGFSACLTKPVRQSQLFDCLATVLGDKAPPASEPTPGRATRHARVPTRRRVERILLAEDNPTNQVVATRLLEKMGFRVVTVANGQEAVRALETVPFDLVMMDVQMPVMDGFAATRAIRSRESAVLNRRVPIIAMTAHALKGDRERCLESGMDDYVSKPIDPRELANVTARWVPPGPGHLQPTVPADAVEQVRA